MKCVILAGGKGSRLSEYTKSIPKPMVKIGGKPIIHHIIDYYRKYKFNEFIIAGGYKYSVIKKYFKNKKNSKYSVKVINTGINTLTGLRIKKLKKFLDNETFMMTYGDGLSNIKLDKLLVFHKKNKKIMTISAVHPPARFGELNFKRNLVTQFKEKPQLQKGWINGGFFVIEPDIFKILSNKNVMLEREPISQIVKRKQICAFRHKGFWYCMDNMRDKKVLESLYKLKKLNWLK